MTLTYNRDPLGVELYQRAKHLRQRSVCCSKVIVPIHTHSRPNACPGPHSGRQ